MVYSGEPSTVQVKNRVLLMPVFRFLGDKVTRSGSVTGETEMRHFSIPFLSGQGDGEMTETMEQNQHKDNLLFIDFLLYF